MSLPPDNVGTICEDGLPGQGSVSIARKALDSGYIHRIHLWSSAGSKGFQLMRGPCSVLATDCGTFAFCLIIPVSQAKRNCVIFGVYLNYLRQAGKIQVPH